MARQLLAAGRVVSRPLEAEREQELIRWALAEGFAVTVREGSRYVILVERVGAVPPPPENGEP